MLGSGWVSYGSSGSGIGQFLAPYGITVSRTGDIYVMDQHNHRIVHFTDMTGTGWTTYGSYGTGTGHFAEPTGIYVVLATWIKTEVYLKPEHIQFFTYPNPFNSAVTISVYCHSREGGNPKGVAVQIFDITGRIVYEMPVGAYRDTSAVWTPEESVGSGVYLVRAKVGSGPTIESVVKRIVYLK